MPGRAGVGAVGLVVLTMLAGGCGGGPSGSAAVIANAGATTRATTARVRTTTIGIEHAEKPVALYSTGLVDFATGDASSVMATQGGGVSSSLESRTVRGQRYLRIDRGTWLPAGNATRARDYPAALAVLSGAGALGGATPDPSQWLGILDDLADVHEEGHPRVDGVAVTRYGGTFDLHDAVATSSTGRKPKVPDEGPSDLDVWIDRTGRVRRLVIAIPSTHGPVLIRTDLTDFGVPVHVTAPSPSEVLHIAPLPEGV